MEYFQVRYDSRVIIYERKMFIRLATGKADRVARGNLKKNYYFMFPEDLSQFF